MDLNILKLKSVVASFLLLITIGCDGFADLSAVWIIRRSKELIAPVSVGLNADSV